MCNVSRWAAVLTSAPGAPATRALTWSHYLGFSSTIFSAYDAAYAADPSVVVLRPADIMNGCIHRFSDSRAVMDGTEIVIFDYFKQDAPVNRCLVEQYQLYLPPTWTTEKQNAWNACLATNLAARGMWGMQVLRESDGVGLTGSLNTYVWGATDRLLPSGEWAYLVEWINEATVAFDLSDHTPGALWVGTLVGGLWQDQGSFPVVGRPRLRSVAAGGARGVGAFSSFAELTLADVDGDGVDEVQLEDGTWIGFEGGAFVVVPGP
jgi:hypothetical protein